MTFFSNPEKGVQRALFQDSEEPLKAEELVRELGSFREQASACDEDEEIPEESA